MKELKVKLSLYSSFFVLSMLLNTVGIVISQVIEEYGVRHVTASTLEIYKDYSIAIASFFFASYVIRIGYKRTILIGLFALTLVSMLVASVTGFWVTAVLYVVTGSSFAFIKVSVYSIIGLMTQTQQEHTSFINKLEGFFQTGALVGPLIFGFMISFFYWSDTYWVVTILILLSLILLYVTDIDESAVEHKVEHTGFIDMLKLMKFPMVWVFVICAFLYVMIEQGFNTWMPSFNREVIGLSPAQSAALFSIFPGSIALSRFLAGYLSRRIDWLVLQLTYLACAFVLTLSVLLLTLNFTAGQYESWTQVPVIAIVFLSVGFFLGPIYPTISSIVLSNLDKARHGEMTGLIIIFSALGGSTGSLLIGTLSEILKVHTAFFFLLIPMVVLSVMLFVYKKVSDKFEKGDSL